MSYRKWIVVAVVLFLGGVALGIFAPGRFSEIISNEIKQLENLGQSLAPFTITTFAFIFARNTLALVGTFVLSPILLLAPVISLIINGLVISYLSAAIAQKTSILFVLAGILPHGVIEIPALIMGLAAALSFGAAIIASLFKKEKKKQFVLALKQNGKFLLIAIGLLLPAAAIETYLTPLLSRYPRASPWHFITQASLDLNPGVPDTRHT